MWGRAVLGGVGGRAVKRCEYRGRPGFGASSSGRRGYGCDCGWGSPKWSGCSFGPWSAPGLSWVLESLVGFGDLMVDGVSSRRRGARPRHSLGVVRHSPGWGGAGQPPCWCWPHGHQCGVGCDTGPMTWGCSRRPGRGGRGRGGGGVPAGQDVVAGVTQDVMRFAGQFAGH